MTSGGHPVRLEAALSQAMLRSERSRVAIMGLVLIGLAVVLSTLWLVTDEAFSTLGESADGRYLGIGALLAGAAYEGLVWRWLGGCLARGVVPGRGVLAAVVAVETTFPTVLLLVFTGFVPAPEALTAPPSYGYLLLISMTILQLDPRVCLLSGVLAAAQFSALTLVFADGLAAYEGTLLGIEASYHVRSMLFIGAGATAALVARELRRQMVESITILQERDRALDLFGQHVSPAVARALMDGAPEQSRREVVVLFLDIRDFTRFSSTRPPDEVVAYLDRLFGPLMEIVRQHGGVVNKLLGDGFMALFGAPEPDDDAARHAVEAARAMLDACDAMMADGVVPATRLGIGIHRGPAMTGLVGSGRRREYTVIGDTVNLAARVEGQCKVLDAELLVTDAVWQALPPALQVGEPHPGVDIRGRRAPVDLYRLR